MTLEDESSAQQSDAETRIAVIGAGLAGLSCAQNLNTAGLDVTVFDKSRGLGGRLATRRADGLAFDHGAQYLTAQSAPFKRFVNANEDTLASWTPHVDGERRDSDWLVGTPGMSSVGKALAEGIAVSKACRIIGLQRPGTNWHLTSEAGETFGPFARLAIAIPAPQAFELLLTASIEMPELNDVIMAPCWTLMLAFERSSGLDFDALRPSTGPIGWIARNDSKPGRDSTVEQWVVQAGPDWSRHHLENNAVEIEKDLLGAFQALAPVDLPPPVFSAAHRWRFALVEKPLGRPCLFEQDSGFGLAGDWCIAPRGEAAFESGVALAGEILTSLE